MSSKRRIKRRSCLGKIRYKTNIDAFNARRFFVKKYNLKEYYGVYHCKFCNGYHIGRSKNGGLAWKKKLRIIQKEICVKSIIL